MDGEIRFTLMDLISKFEGPMALKKSNVREPVTKSPAMRKNVSNSMNGRLHSTIQAPNYMRDNGQHEPIIKTTTVGNNAKHHLAFNENGKFETQANVKINTTVVNGTKTNMRYDRTSNGELQSKPETPIYSNGNFNDPLPKFTMISDSRPMNGDLNGDVNKTPKATKTCTLLHEPVNKPYQHESSLMKKEDVGSIDGDSLVPGSKGEQNGDNTKGTIRLKNLLEGKQVVDTLHRQAVVRMNSLNIMLSCLNQILMN